MVYDIPGNNKFQSSLPLRTSRILYSRATVGKSTKSSFALGGLITFPLRFLIMNGYVRKEYSLVTDELKVDNYVVIGPRSNRLFVSK